MFICAFGFYMYIRVTKTLGLGSYFWYGCLVLGVEVLGATTTLHLRCVSDSVHVFRLVVLATYKGVQAAWCGRLSICQQQHHSPNVHCSVSDSNCSGYNERCSS